MRLALTGDWTAVGLGRVSVSLTSAIRQKAPTQLDVSALGAADTAGLFVLLREAALDPQLLQDAEVTAARPDLQRLAALVLSVPPDALPVTHHGASVFRTLVRFGRGVEQGLHEGFLTLAFYGEFISAIGRVIAEPRRLRPAATVSLMERAGLDAIPIVAATNFFVGATIAFLGANLLAQFGAAIFTVELVGVGVLREFGVLITAVILAGRSASSFAAEIGAMRMNQEVDAMEVMGVDPFDALVVPRFIAMLTMTPLLTFIAMMAGMAGGLLVIWGVLDLSPQFFAQRLIEHVGIKQFWLGLAKAPVMAMVIAAVGCRQGMEVGGDVEQLGRKVTAAVVQAVFAIIVIDAVFALIFLELNL